MICNIEYLSSISSYTSDDFKLSPQRRASVYRRYLCGFFLCTLRPHFAWKTLKALMPTCLIYLLPTGTFIKRAFVQTFTKIDLFVWFGLNVLQTMNTTHETFLLSVTLGVSIVSSSAKLYSMYILSLCICFQHWISCSISGLWCHLLLHQHLQASHTESCAEWQWLPHAPPAALPPSRPAGLPQDWHRWKQQ